MLCFKFISNYLDTFPPSSKYSCKIIIINLKMCCFTYNQIIVDMISLEESIYDFRMLFEILSRAFIIFFVTKYLMKLDYIFLRVVFRLQTKLSVHY